jgi:hypothetical protein
MKDDKLEKKLDDKLEEKDTQITFGLSSFLFIIPWAYSQFTFTTAFRAWSTALLILPFTSYFCNAYPDKKYQIFDHTIIVVLAMIYFLYHRRIFIPLLIYILYITELYFAKDISTTVMISFVALNLFAFTNFTRPEMLTGLIVFTLATVCKLYRNSNSKIYPFCTTLWHIGCVVLLILASRSINATFSKKVI